MQAWLYWLFLGIIGGLVYNTFFRNREKLTMLSENKVVDGWGNVTLTP